MLRSTALAFCALLLVSLGCNNSPTKGAPGSETATGNTLDKGFCADTCPKACDKDDDCRTADGELCCDFGSDGKACTAARECPRRCSNDSRCDTMAGEACVRVSLENKATICADVQSAIQLCKADIDCKSAGDVCCEDFNEPVCLPARFCPKICRASSDCKTSAGEICCTTIPKIDKSVKAGGLCLSSDEIACPSACKQSSECNTQRGEICCDGFCSDSCEHSCTASSDCNGQICCKTRAARSTLYAGSGSESGSGVTELPGGSSGSSSASCVPGEVSTPGSASDPCPQTSPTCPSSMGYVAVNTCQPNGLWKPQCDCVAKGSAPIGSGCSGFVCNDGECLEASWRCDGEVDCPSGEDEAGCGTAGRAGSGAGGSSAGGAGSSSSCASLNTDDCSSCCEQAYPSGAQEFLGYVTDCVCGSGACADICKGSAFCDAPDLATPVNSACNSCLSDMCAADLANQCTGSTQCSSYLNCAGGC